MNPSLLKFDQPTHASDDRKCVDAQVNPEVPLAARAAELLLRSIPEDSTREGLLRTPARFASAFDHLCSGYLRTARDVVGEGVFKAEGDGLVAVRDVEFYSLCEHHMLPFWGKASVAYYPSEMILGLSKIPRLIDLHARRLQVQERLTESVARDLQEIIQPRALVVRVEAQHLCMMMRGVEKQGSWTVSEATRNTCHASQEEMRRLFDAVQPR